MATNPRSIDPIFHEALQHADPAARAAYLAQACGDDRELRAEVDRLLAAVLRMGEFLNQPPIASGAGDKTAVYPSDESLAGQSIGPFKLLQKLGEGGMGVVYLAEQEAPVRRRVAVKVIRAGMDSAQVVARFEHERQALALMEHPNIARVLDAGVTTDGRPYFAMELVHGIPITKYCDQEMLSLHDRIRLFVPVCRAVQHAHQKGIIHRDLKPSNVIVGLYDGQPIPKVIDFGVAKATGQRLVERTMFTEVGQIIGTIEYMAPEQAEMNNLDVDTRADIYSLGVLLYELLAGRPPFSAQELRAAGFGEMLRIIKEVDPTKPSTKITGAEDLPQVAANRQIEPARLARLVSGELDWITMKCLEKSRIRRYETANGLAQDLERFLNDLPVEAHPPTTAYRLRKFVRHHRAALATATIVALAVLGGAIGTGIGLIRARAAAADAEAVNEFMRDVLTSVEPDAKGADVRLVEVLGDASTSAATRFATNPLREGSIRTMLGQVYSHLAMPKEAGAEFQKAIDRLQIVLPGDDRRLLYVEVQLAKSMVNLRASSQVQEKLDGLLPRVRQAFGADDPLALEAERLDAVAEGQLGSREQAENKLRGLKLRADAVGADDAVHIAILNSLIMTLRTGFGRSADDDRLRAAEIERLAGEMARRSVTLNGPDALQTMRAQMFVADMMNVRGEFKTAAEICKSILETSHDRLAKNHTQNMETMRVLAKALYRLGDPASAAELMLQRVELSRAQESPVFHLAKIADAFPYLDRGGLWVKGESLSREFRELLRTFAGNHADLQFAAGLYAARFATLLGRVDDADVQFKSLAEQADRMEGNSLGKARLHLFFGSHLRVTKQYPESENQLLSAALMLNDLPLATVPTSPNEATEELIALYEDWEKPDLAASWREQLTYPTRPH